MFVLTTDGPGQLSTGDERAWLEKISVQLEKQSTSADILDGESVRALLREAP